MAILTFVRFLHDIIGTVKKHLNINPFKAAKNFTNSPSVIQKDVVKLGEF